MKIFGGVKRTDPPAGVDAYGKMLAAAGSDLRQPAERQQAKPANGPHPDALSWAAWYLAGVVCHQNRHEHDYGHWPCKQSLVWAETEIHQLASTKLRKPRGQNARRPPKKRKNGVGKAGRKAVTRGR